VAVVGFEPLRRWDREAEARAFNLETLTAILQVYANWITNDEAADRVVGHRSVGPITPGLGQGGGSVWTSPGSQATGDGVDQSHGGSSTGSGTDEAGAGS
jgi:hypothetical protein